MEGSKILIVDDSRLFAEFLLSVVTTRGYTGIIASGGREALNALKGTAFNLILLDLELPDIHGNEVLKIIRSNKALNEVAVIVISGTNDPDKIIKSLEFGANDFISKPFNEMMLGLKIKNLLMLQKSNLLLRDEIDHHKTTMAELAKTRNDLETVFQSSPVAMIIADEHLKIKKTNLAASEFFRNHPADITGMDPGELINCINVKLNHLECGNGDMCKTCHLRNILEETVSTHNNINKRESKIQVLSDSGTENLSLYVSSIVLTIEDKDHILLCIEDITERERMVANLRELVATKEKLLSVIAHDLRNPFNILLGMSEMLIKKIELDELDKARNYAQHIFKTSEQTYSLLDNLLSWTRAQTGKLVPKKCHFKVLDVTSELQRLLASELSEKKINIIEQIPEELFVFADANMIKTVFRNLLTNAIKFSYPGNSITITASEDQSIVKISVSDNGLGIPEEDITKLFRIETNISTAGTSEEKGSGLGLVICREFIELNGGKIWVESKHESGSTFFFTLLKESK